MEDLVFKAGQCWTDGSTRVQRLREEDDGYAFEYWQDNRWYPTTSPGYKPFTPCEDPSKPEWRNGLEAMHWALDNPERELADVYDNKYRFSNGRLETLDRVCGWSCCQPGRVYLRPVSGTW